MFIMVIREKSWELLFSTSGSYSHPHQSSDVGLCILLIYSCRGLYNINIPASVINIYRYLQELGKFIVFAVIRRSVKFC